MSSNEPFHLLLKPAIFFGTFVMLFLVVMGSSYADYEPQGGAPPRGGSTNSGMRLEQVPQGQ